MKRILLITVVSVMAACSAPSLESNLASEDAANVNGNCFTELNPAGGVSDGKFEQVHFYNGNCADNTRALNKLAMKDDVLVILGSTRQKSPLYLEGQDVSVKVDGESFKIGELVPTEAEPEFVIDSTVSFDLMVFDEDGDASAWKYGDSTRYSKEEIAILL